jgi:hypothetical protein
MRAIFFSTVPHRSLFIYKIEGSVQELENFKLNLNSKYRESRNGSSLFFTKFFSGLTCEMTFYNGNYMTDFKKLHFLQNDFALQQQNLWSIIDHCTSLDPFYYTPEHLRTNVDKTNSWFLYDNSIIESVEPMWSLNRIKNKNFNNNFHLVPIPLKQKLLKVLEEYSIPIQKHVFMNKHDFEAHVERLKNARENYRETLIEASNDAYFTKKMINAEINSWGTDWYWNID